MSPHFEYTSDQIVGTCLGFLVSLVNIVALIVLSKCTEMVSQIRIYAMNLATSDFLLGIFWIVSLLFIGPSIEGMQLLHYRIYIHILSCLGMVSVSSVCCLAWDRFLTCFRPMDYPYWITKKKAIACNIAVWIFANILSGFTYHGLNDIQTIKVETWLMYDFALTVDCISYIGFFVFIVIVYGLTMQHAKKSANRVIPQHLNQNGNLTSFFHFFRSSAVTLCISCCVIVCHIGIFLIIAIAMVMPKELRSTHIHSLHIATCGLCLSASLLNPLLYVWRFKECQIKLLSVFSFFSEKLKRKLEDMNDEFVSGKILAISPTQENIDPNMFDFSFIPKDRNDSSSSPSPTLDKDGDSSVSSTGISFEKGTDISVFDSASSTPTEIPSVVVTDTEIHVGRATDTDTDQIVLATNYTAIDCWSESTSTETDSGVSIEVSES